MRATNGMIINTDISLQCISKHGLYIERMKTLHFGHF